MFVSLCRIVIVCIVILCLRSGISVRRDRRASVALFVSFCRNVYLVLSPCDSGRLFSACLSACYVWGTTHAVVHCILHFGNRQVRCGIVVAGPGQIVEVLSWLQSPESGLQVSKVKNRYASEVAVVDGYRDVCLLPTPLHPSTLAVLAELD